jgi:competence protein ComEC
VFKTLTGKYPPVLTVIPFAIGILIGYYSGLNLSFLSYGFFITVLLVLTVVIVYVYKTIAKGMLFLFSYAALLVLMGIFSFQFRYYIIEENDVSKFTDDHKDKKSLIKGTIAEQPEVKDDKIRILVDAEMINGTECKGYILATVYKNKFKEDTERNYIYGDEIEIEGRLEQLPHKRNPGEFDYGEYLRMHNISAVFTAFGFDNINITGHAEQSFYKEKIIYPVKDYSINIIDKLIGGDEGEYLKGLVLGERSNISQEMKQNFINAGVAHIIAVSGLNVAYVIIIIWGVLTFIPIR